MPLKWKKTVVERERKTFTVTHWEKHSPHALLKTVHGEPEEEVGTHPNGRVFQFGKHRIIAREFPSMGMHNEGETLWSALQELAEKKAAIVEMPVALVQQKRQPPTIVTIWKKDSRPLNLFLADNKVSTKRKEQACRSAVRNLAQLHAAGFRHGHINPDNFVVDRAGNAKLIDYTFLSPLRRPSTFGLSRASLTREVEQNQAVRGLVRETHQWPYPPHGTDEDRKKTGENTDRLRQELNEEYEKYFKKYKPLSWLRRLFRRR